MEKFNAHLYYRIIIVAQKQAYTRRVDASDEERTEIVRETEVFSSEIVRSVPTIWPLDEGLKGRSDAYVDRYRWSR